MEDDEDSDGEAPNVTREDEDHGPFNNLRDLLCHQAHLTVFLNYVISNSDPAPLVRSHECATQRQDNIYKAERSFLNFTSGCIVFRKLFCGTFFEY